MPKNIGVALALGAGGSRGLAHVGVIEVFEEEGIPIDLIVGSSAGSLVGAMYADDPNADRLKEKLIRLKKEDLLDPSYKEVFRMTGLMQGNALEQFLVNELDSACFEDLKIPLVAVACNVENNRIVLLRTGPIAPAVHASAALPPVFSPVKLYNEILVDGGVIAPVPVNVARLYKPKLLIAVDISTPPSKDPLSNAFDFLYRSLHISFYELSRLQTNKADIFIHPDLAGFGTFEDDHNEELYVLGKVAARKAVANIKKEMRRKGIKLRPQKKKRVVI